MAWRFLFRPVLPFVLELLLLAPLILAPDATEASGVYMFVFPWLILALVFINLPFVSAAFRAFRLDLPTQRNHALEHATIHYLRLRGARRLSGTAETKDFV